MTRCWEGPLGAVRPLDAPSWLMAEPLTTASTGWPFLRASERRSTTSMPTPSEKPAPSACSANALQRPSAARPPCTENSANRVGVAMTVMPPASASEHSPCRSAWAGHVQRHQRGGTGGVDGDGRALQPEGVRHPARQHRRGVAGADVPADVLAGADEHGRVVLAVGAREDAGGRRPSATAGRSRPAPAPPTRSPGEDAAAGPSPAPHAARSRRTPRRSRRPRPRSRPGG